jgi:hypothetical protein
MKEHIAKFKVWWNKPLEIKLPKSKLKEGFHCPDCIDTTPHLPHDKKLPSVLLDILNNPKTNSKIAKAMMEGHASRLEHERLKRFFEDLQGKPKPPKNERRKE